MLHEYKKFRLNPSKLMYSGQIWNLSQQALDSIKLKELVSSNLPQAFMAMFDRDKHREGRGRPGEGQGGCIPKQQYF